MPRHVRNFWITLDVDDKKHKIATGPPRKDGGFNLNIKMRDQNSIDNIEIDICGSVEHTEDGNYLQLIINEKDCVKPLELNTIYTRFTKQNKTF